MMSTWKLFKTLVWIFKVFCRQQSWKRVAYKELGSSFFYVPISLVSRKISCERSNFSRAVLGPQVLAETRRWRSGGWGVPSTPGTAREGAVTTELGLPAFGGRAWLNTVSAGSSVCCGEHVCPPRCHGCSLASHLHSPIVSAPKERAFCHHWRLSSETWLSWEMSSWVDLLVSIIDDLGSVSAGSCCDLWGHLWSIISNFPCHVLPVSSFRATPMQCHCILFPFAVPS